MASLFTVNRATFSIRRVLFCCPNYLARSFHSTIPSNFDYVSAAAYQRFLVENSPKTQKNPFLISGSDAPLDIKINEEGMYFRIDIPGVLSKDEVKVWVEKNLLIFKGYGSKASEHDESGQSYGGSLEYDPWEYNLDAEMKNGVLRYFVPRFKLE